MQHDTLQRLLDLVGKTGDRIIVTDPAGDAPYVLMSLDQYEGLIGGKGKPAASEAPKTPESAPAPARRPHLQVAEDLDPPVALGSAKKREIPLWKPSQAPKPTEATPPAAAKANDADSEEQFYLEPLE